MTKKSDPCPCGSGKKYKRCCGVDPAALEKRKAAATSGFGAEGGASPGGMSGMPGLPAGFDPSKMDPAQLKQMRKSLAKIPKGQLMKMQSLVKQAMAGKNVEKELEALSAYLPPEFAQAAEGMGESETPADMTADQAAKIVQEAVAKGEISVEEAKKLIPETKPNVLKSKSGFWDFFKKKEP